VIDTRAFMPTGMTASSPADLVGLPPEDVR
jgi:hypothetical protein